MSKKRSLPASQDSINKKATNKVVSRRNETSSTLRKVNQSRSRWRSVEAKLLQSLAISLSVAVICAGVALVIFGSQNYRIKMIQSLEVIGQIAADRSAASLVFRDSYAAQRNLQTAKHKESIEKMCLYTAEGELFSEYLRAESVSKCARQGALSTALRVQDEGSLIHISIPVVDQGDVLGHLVLYSNTNDLSSARYLFISALAGALVFALVVALLIGRSLLARILMPMQELYKTSRVIAKNPLANVRAKKVSDDEFGRVVDVFNSMLDAFGEENKALLQSENRFRSLSENSPVGVYLKRGSSDHQYTNETWAMITGLRGEDIRGFISRIDVRDRESYKNCLIQAAQSGRPQVVEFQYIYPGGAHRTLMEYVSCIHEGEEAVYVGSLLDVTELKNAQVELEKLAFYDPLTQLPNRRFFRDHLDFSIARAAKEDKQIAVLMVDLDDFKKVNDSLGHDVGDALLVKIARQLRNAVFDEDVVSRMGGDEFMILVDNLDDPSRLDQASQKVLTALKASVESHHQSLQVSGSVGAAIYPTDAQTPEELLRYADIALYNSKAKGRATYSYYSSDLDEKIKEKLRLEQKLRHALANNELDVFVQPQYIAHNRQMFWGEVLIRWIDDEDGFIAPDIFIPIAEETGLIHDIGDFVLSRVCELLHQHAEQFEALGMDGLSINLSAKQFFSSSIIDKIKESFAQYQIQPCQVEFEITETIVMDDVEQAVVVMEAIRELGCRLSIDDFGTGYSSLSYLKRFPITSLKIDRTFIRDIPEDKNDIEIACAIIAMAHSMGLTVVAEGVESELQANLLASYNCEYLQGYFLERPMPFHKLFASIPQETSRSLIKSKPKAS